MKQRHFFWEILTIIRLCASKPYDFKVQRKFMIRTAFLLYSKYTGVILILYVNCWGSINTLKLTQRF
jgi:hypothetical protein